MEGTPAESLSLPPQAAAWGPASGSALGVGGGTAACRLPGWPTLTPAPGPEGSLALGEDAVLRQCCRSTRPPSQPD